MSTVAIMNSARKAMEKARRLSAQSGQCTGSGSRRVVSWEKENSLSQPKVGIYLGELRRAVGCWNCHGHAFISATLCCL